MSPARLTNPTTTLLLTLWHEAGGQWHARVIAADGSTREFTSPVELARWSAAAGMAPAPATVTPNDETSPPRGLR
jgi:hypothetical protein